MSSIISVENLSKAYRVGKKKEGADSLVGMLQDSITAPFRNWRSFAQPSSQGSENENIDDDIHWALRDVSFEVKQGEVLGIIGRNGAGKSTLLKILSRITEPTSGCVRIRGRVSSLLEVGTGFHPELSGRENTYLNGTILGMTKREIDKKFNEIVDFSGVEKFLDTPVKRYSSGMKVRLAFAVAAHLEPEILIIDEVLAVGDATFQKRCLDRINVLAKEGITVLIVSHNLDIVDRLCTRAILMKQGKLANQGNVLSVISDYLADGRLASYKRDLRDELRTGDGRAKFTKIAILDDQQADIENFITGNTLRVAMTIESRDSLEDVGIAVVLTSPSGARIVTSWNREANSSIDIQPGSQNITCDFESLPLRPGHELWISLWLEQGGSVVDSIEHAMEVRASPKEDGSCSLSPDRAQGIIAVSQLWQQHPQEL